MIHLVGIIMGSSNLGLPDTLRSTYSAYDQYWLRGARDSIISPSYWNFRFEDNRTVGTYMPDCLFNDAEPDLAPDFSPVIRRYLLCGTSR